MTGRRAHIKWTAIFTKLTTQHWGIGVVRGGGSKNKYWAKWKEDGVDWKVVGVAITDNRIRSGSFAAIILSVSPQQEL